MTSVTRLPDLRGRPAPGATGWCAITASSVHVPDLDDARRCALVPVEPSTCEARPIAFDLPDDVIVVRIPEGGTTVTVTFSAPWLEPPPVLIVEAVPGGDPLEVAGEITHGGTRIVYRDALTDALADGEYRLFVAGFEGFAQSFTIETGGSTSALPTDPCALTLVPSIRTAVAEGPVSGALPAPPLVAVDRRGCIVPAWSVNERGWALVPVAPHRVELRAGASGGVIATIEDPAGIRDAVFFHGRVAVLTSGAVVLHDFGGCPVEPTLAIDVDDGVMLATLDGDLLVAQRGTTSPAGAKNLRRLRLDGTELAPPEVFDDRGWLAHARSAAFGFDVVACAFVVDPRRSADDCCTEAARPLTAEESALFRLVADLPQLRQRRTYPSGEARGTVVLGPAAPLDPLDAGRPGTAWHRVRLFGEIPAGCVVELETRSSDDLLGGDPRVPGGWSRAATATASSSVPTSAPADLRVLAADFMVLARPGRFLWLRLSLRSDGISTPRITSVEIERPRVGIARHLPRVYQDSTPDDDFLRRWLALFETTAFDGVAGRLDAYPELFDPRTAPEGMLPYLAGWLEMPTPDVVLRDAARLRRILVAAPEIARLRGTARGLELIVRVYTDVVARVRESFRLAGPFVLGAGASLGLAQGPVLGCQTWLSAEPRPTDLGEAALGCTVLTECDERTGGTASEFELLVGAQDLCSSATRSLIELLVEHEKPAHTRYRITELAPAGFVVGTSSIVGQAVARDYVAGDERTFGIAVGNGPRRPKPVGRGLRLGRDSRLVGRGQSIFSPGASVGRTTRVG